MKTRILAKPNYHAEGPLLPLRRAVGDHSGEAETRNNVGFEFSYLHDRARFLLVSGEPLRVPAAWYGPIVMNTQEQLQQAFEELSAGTFLNSAKQKTIA
jgi:hypothetical protein